jgi:predicted lysophospholipase L1 biosynthesis ABC-type transport system permease subunit
MTENESIKCPSCGANLPDDTVAQLLKKEEKEFSFLILGVVLGAIIGLVGNVWVAFLFEVIKTAIPEAQWFPSSVLGLAITTIVSIYVIVKMFRFAVKYMGVEVKHEIRNEGVET